MAIDSTKAYQLLVIISSVVSACITAWITAKPQSDAVENDARKVVIDAAVSVVKLQAELDQIHDEGRDEAMPLFQSMVDQFDRYSSESWVVYKDFKVGKWRFVVVNNTYRNKYKVPFNVRDMLITEAYEFRGLTIEDKEALLTYEVNNERAGMLRHGVECLSVVEKALPSSGVKKSETFIKCPVVQNSVLYVYGHKLLKH